MEVRVVIIIAIALAMDALGIAIGIGLNPNIKGNSKINYLISSAFFQFLFFFLGGIFGYLFEEYIIGIPTLVGGIVIGVVGIMMLKEGFTKDEQDQKLVEKKYMSIILGISVSIDALVVAFTTTSNEVSYMLMFVNSVLVGLITLFICALGFFLCKYIRKYDFITKYADFLGGIILIIFALNMIFF